MPSFFPLEQAHFRDLDVLPSVVIRVDLIVSLPLLFASRAGAFRTPTMRRPRRRQRRAPPSCRRQKSNPAEKVTESAHPARFSPDDNFSRQRVAIKKRFGIYLPDSAMPKPL